MKNETAIREAERFLERAKVIRTMRIEPCGQHAAGPKQSGAARRASLDLTRALADLRRPG